MVSTPSLPSVESAELLQRLVGWMKQWPSVLVAYSGGVDSAVVMAAGAKLLGERAVACIGVSPSYPERELTGAREQAKTVGAIVRVVETREHLDPRYAENPGNRCYFCKSELYDRLKEIALAEGFAVILDGNNATDAASGERPGWMAGRERGVRSPLAELGMTKEQVRAVAKELGLGVWDKPASPCLASRVPHGVPIVPGLLKQIEKAEDALAAMGFREFRVRHHGDVARIEVRREDLAKLVEKREGIVTAVKGAGYRFVTVDLAGFESGGLHRATRERGSEGLRTED